MADNAMICQLTGAKGIMGLTLYNKQEFIDKLTMPSGSLHNLEILSTKSHKGKIVMLRFRLNDKKR